MKLFNIIAIFIYTLLFCIIGAIFIAFSLRTESLNSIINMINYLPRLNNLRLGMALVGLLLILINISIARLSIGKLQRQKTIAFENPYGRVTLSLSAVEDYIKRLTAKMAEIKDIKSNIIAGKSGIEVIAKTTLYSDTNIPEVTEKIQNGIRLRLQEMLGLEEKVTIKIHVAKIAQREDGGTEQGGFKGEIKYDKDVI